MIERVGKHNNDVNVNHLIEAVLIHTQTFPCFERFSGENWRIKCLGRAK